MVNKYITVAGKTIFVRFAMSKEKTGEKRKKRYRPTSEAVEFHNRKKAERDLAILLNSNFAKGDLHVVLTYARDEPTQAEAKKNLDNFFRKLRRRYAKKGLTLKWIATTEYENKRIHHHVVLNQGFGVAWGISTKELAEVWGHGILKTSVLDGSGDYRKLASYLIKETGKTFRASGAVQRQRYSCSRNLIRPITKQEEVSAAMLLKAPKPIKGYYIDQDSLYRGENAVTGLPCMEYVMVSLDAKPRLSIWPRGKRVSDIAGDIWIRGKEKQMSMEF